MSTLELMNPAQLASRAREIQNERAERLQRHAAGVAVTILAKAASEGVKRVYLYNSTFESNAKVYPRSVVELAAKILEDSGWNARVVRIYWWHMFTPFHRNYRLHSGTPAWRIFLTPKTVD